jgi:hypothetical protein
MVLTMLQICYHEIYVDTVPRLHQACKCLDIPANANPYGGDIVGLYNVRKTVEVKGLMQSEPILCPHPLVRTSKSLRELM